MWPGAVRADYAKVFLPVRPIHLNGVIAKTSDLYKNRNSRISDEDFAYFNIGNLNIEN